MIAVCSRCGCTWDAPEEEACALMRLCQACYWALGPGDFLICVYPQPGQPFLIKGWIYTVLQVQKEHSQNLVRVYGSDRLWPLWHFRLSHKPGDTDLKTGM